MSTLAKSPPGLDKSEDYWKDVEVPYGKISNKWDRKYRSRMRAHMKNGRLQKRVLAIYFKLMGRGDDFPHEREEALDELEEYNQDWVFNLCSQFVFSNGISREIIVDFSEKARQDIIDIGLEEELEKNLGGDDSKANKDGLITLYQLANPDLLREILIYSLASKRWPTTAYKRDTGGTPGLSQWDNVETELNKNSVENYGVWYQFEFEGSEYVAIEQEDRDGVERQVGENIEQEPANLIILKFNKSYLDVYTDNRSIAGSVQSGVNKEISGDSYEEERNPTTPDEIQEFGKELVEKDKERDEDKTKDYDYVLTDLEVSETSLPNSPKMKLKSGVGLGKAIKELEEVGYDLLSDPQSIRRVKLQFEEYKFNITNVERSSDSSGKYRELVYGCEADPDTREKFEELISDEFGMDIKYESSQ